MLKKTLHLLILLIALAASEFCYTQEITFPDIRGFKMEMNYPVYTPDNLWDYINGGAEAYNALGFEKLIVVEYTRGKKTSVKLEIYTHRNPDLAFGIYALERSPSYNFAKIGVQGYSDQDFINFLKGRYYVKIYTHSKSAKAIEAVQTLAARIEALLEGTTEFPETLQLFPEGGKKPNQEMFISENVLGHEFLANAYRSSYGVDESDFDIYLFKADEPGQLSRMLSGYLKRHDLDTGGEASGKVTFRDGYNGTIFLAWKNNIMILLSGLGEKETDLANSYIDIILNQ